MKNLKVTGVLVILGLVGLIAAQFSFSAPGDRIYYVTQPKFTSYSSHRTEEITRVTSAVNAINYVPAPRFTNYSTARAAEIGYLLGTIGAVGMVFPSTTGVAVYNGAGGWSTSRSNPSGDIVGTIDAQTLTNKLMSTGSTWQGNSIGSDFGGAGTINGLLKANGTGHVTQAAAGGDYLTPTGSGGGLTGITPGQIGLGNVDNTSDATRNSATATLTNKTLTTPKVTTEEISAITNSQTLTAAQVSRTVLTNYGQSADVIANLPAPVQGLTFVAVAGTSIANKWGFKSYSTSKINFDGTELTARAAVKVASTALGNYLSCMTFKSSSHALFQYQWLCRTGQGTWVTE